MTTWKLVFLGHELLRLEREEDADKTLGQAMAELMESSGEEEEEPEGFPEGQWPMEVAIASRMVDGEHVVWDAVVDEYSTANPYRKSTNSDSAPPER